MSTWPFGKLKRRHYRAILVDPPIPFKTYSRKGEGRSPQHHYACLLPEQLTALPIAELAAPDGCFLFSWITPRSVFLTEPLMRAWGFKFSGKGFLLGETQSQETDALHGRRLRHQEKFRGLLARAPRRAET